MQLWVQAMLSRHHTVAMLLKSVIAALNDLLAPRAIGTFCSYGNELKTDRQTKLKQYGGREGRMLGRKQERG